MAACCLSWIIIIKKKMFIQKTYSTMLNSKNVRKKITIKGVRSPQEQGIPQNPATVARATTTTNMMPETRNTATDAIGSPTDKPYTENCDFGHIGRYSKQKLNTYQNLVLHG
jgi:hypothetical protein